MAYPAFAVANSLLDLAANEGVEISPMKLQKLVYYCHGWNLAITDSPLIDEQVECWQYGPVVNSLFHEFKGFGSQPIDRYASVVEGEGEEFTWVIPEVPSDDQHSHRVIRMVWDAYKQYSATRLSNMTHASGGPWERVVKTYNGTPPKGTDIPSDWIKEYFKAALETS